MTIVPFWLTTSFVVFNIYISVSCCIYQLFNFSHEFQFGIPLRGCFFKDYVVYYQGGNKYLVEIDHDRLSLFEAFGIVKYITQLEQSQYLLWWYNDERDKYSTMFADIDVDDVYEYAMRMKTEVHLYVDPKDRVQVTNDSGVQRNVVDDVPSNVADVVQGNVADDVPGNVADVVQGDVVMMSQVMLMMLLVVMQMKMRIMMIMTLNLTVYHLMIVKMRGNLGWMISLMLMKKKILQGKGSKL